jgi:xylulokinase
MDNITALAAAYWLGLDFGTSSVKALLIDSNGRVAARADESYPTVFGPDGAAEQDPYDYLKAARAVIARCGAAGLELRGIGIVGQTPTLVAVDVRGDPVRPALTWQDFRAEAEARELASEYGPASRLFGIDLPWTPAYPPAKLLWLARHERETVRRTRWVLQPKDFVGLRLTDSPLSDPWSTKGLCNVLDLTPAAEAMTRAGWSVEVVPPLAPAWEARGWVTARAAAELSLPEGVPVAVGWSDALAGMLAVGAFDEPTAFVLTGTSSIVGISTERGVPSGGDLLTIPSTCAPLSISYGPTQSGGASLEWLARLLRSTVAEVLALAASVPVDSRDLPIFVPYLAGERAPVWRTDVRGAMLGLSLDHGAAELARSVVLGVCLSELHVLVAAEEQLGTRAPNVRVAGRGASTRPWRDARLAVLGRPLLLLGEPDASALGAAMLAAAAVNGGKLTNARPLRGKVECLEPRLAREGGPSRPFDRYLQASRISRAWADGFS